MIDLSIDDHLSLLRAIQGRVPEKELAIVIYQEMNKDRRGKEAGESRISKFAPEIVKATEGASEKQIAFLKKHAPEISMQGITKAKAFELIQGITDSWKKLGD